MPHTFLPAMKGTKSEGGTEREAWQHSKHWKGWTCEATKIKSQADAERLCDFPSEEARVRLTQHSFGSLGHCAQTWSSIVRPQLLSPAWRGGGELHRRPLSQNQVKPQSILLAKFIIFNILEKKKRNRDIKMQENLD